MKCFIHTLQDRRIIGFCVAVLVCSAMLELLNVSLQAWGR